MTPSPPERIDLEMLVLRRSLVQDAAMIASAVGANLAHLAPWMPWATPESATEAAQRERLVAAAPEWDDGVSYEFLLLDRRSGDLLGIFGLHRRLGPGAIELGYWLGLDAVGQGHATAAARALTQTALDLPDVHRVEIHCDEANARSQRVPDRLGYRLDRVQAGDVDAPAETGRTMIWVFPADPWDVEPTS
jgi:RimJ/RimL family protein N-acetyltransferase